jgi:benzoyl-CoA reductase subunit C
MEELLARAGAAAWDMDLSSVRQWKSAAPGRRAIGFMPIWAPREIIHAAGMLPVGIMGGGDRIEIIRGDAYFQSYICHIPRSTTELGVSGRLDALDGMIFPSICDVIRNLSGMWQILFPDRFVHYFDFPQSEESGIAARHCARELTAIRAGLGRLSGSPVTDDAIRASIGIFNENGRLVRELYALRMKSPWKVPASEAYQVLRAGCVMPIEEHSALLREYIDGCEAADRRRLDNIRIVLTGSFCEQPPVALLKTLERAGCDLVDDDLILGNRFIGGAVSTEGDPVEALARAFVEKGAHTASRYSPEARKGQWLVDRVRATRADGVIFCAASFCDPALLEEPMLKAALDAEGISYTSFKFSEDTGQFQGVREQTGTFADSIRLWSEA